MEINASFRRVLAIGGGLLVFLVFALVGGALFRSPAIVGYSPALENAITAVPAVVLFSILWKARNTKNRVFQTAIPKGLLIISPLLVLLVPCFGRSVSDLTVSPEFLSAIVACLLCAVGEEFMFRGYLHGLCERWNLALALIIPSVLFGICHYQSGLPQVFTTSVMGFSFGLARIGGLSLFTLTLIHGAINLPAILPYTETQYLGIASLLALSYSFILAITFVVFPRHWSNKAVVARSAV